MKLSLPQEDVYFEQLMYPKDPIYNIGAKISIEGTLVYEVFNDAYKMLINQHDAFRSVLNHDQAVPEIDIREADNDILTYLDFSAYENAVEEVTSFMQERFEKPFQLAEKKPLYKFILIKVKETHHYLFSVYHHLITDGWGTSLMFQRLVKNYNELMELGAIKSVYPYSYKDFVADDQSYALSEAYEKDKVYWKEKFKELPQRLLEKMVTTEKSNQSKRKAVFIKRAVYNQLTQTGKEVGCSTFHVILGIIYLYFGRKHQNRDFAIGLPVLNRGKRIFKNTVGLFMGISPLRIALDFDDNFEALIKNIKQGLRQNYRHQRFPLGKLIKALELFQEKDRLFNITLSYEKQSYADHFLNTKTTVIPLSHHSERVALAIYIREFDEMEDVKIDFDYNVNYFDEPAISQVVSHFETLLMGIIANTQKSLSQYQYITDAEKQNLRFNFNQTQFNYDKEANVIDLFRNQVNRRPTKIALEEEANSYTYLALDKLSDRIANYLQQRFHQRPGIPIAVFINRSAKLIATLLGILKSGSVFIPLDSSFPKERLAYIINHSEVALIIGTEDLEQTLQFDKEFLAIETLLRSKENGLPLATASLSSASLAYIIYTSGSTGKPKGVAISHQSLVNLLISVKHQPGLDQADRFFSVTTPSFDISILEFFAPLITGASIYVASQKLLSDPLAIVDKLESWKPTVMQATPSFYQMLYNVAWKGSKTLKILCGGDLLSETLAEKLLTTNAVLWNMYGPTETTIWSSCKKITKAFEASNIGKPIHNTAFYILDEALQLLPIGTVGNVYIGGDGLAQAYYKNEVLTKEKFIVNPFDKSKKIYHTGDLGKWNELGEIEFLGRNDYQVKIRGYRIELGEIETKLDQIKGIRSSIVIAQKKRHQEARLIAYILKEDQSLKTETIKNELSEKLPAYMIPYIIIPIKEFPLTLNKKVNRKALEAKKVNIKSALFTGDMPTTELEIALSNYYKEVLNIAEEITVVDDFFTLGGHSLNAVKLINLIEEQLHCRLNLKAVFDYPTIRTLAAFLEEKATQQARIILPVDKREYYSVSAPQQLIWLASQQPERSMAYHMPAVFEIKGEIDKAVLETVLLDILEKYEILRTNFIAVAGIPKQKINPPEKLSFEIQKIFAAENDLVETIDNFVNKVFNLESDLLIRIALVAQNNQRTYLVFNTHHIVMDGWSLEILINELISKYKALQQQEKPKDLKPKLQFKDYAEWHQSQLENTTAKNLDFWKDHLRNYTWGNRIPFDLESSSVQNEAATREFKYAGVELTALKQLMQAHKISLHSFLIASFNMLIHKMYGSEDSCIGTVNAGRTSPTLQNQLGMFVKTLPLRTRLKADTSVQEILQQTQEKLLQIDEHQDLPEVLQNVLRLDILLVLENPSYSYKQIELSEKLQLQSYPISTAYSKLPLLVSFSVREENIWSSIDYDVNRYEQATIELINLKFERLLKEIIKRPHEALSSINIDLEIEVEKVIDIDFDF
ncbi:MAG: amino acid adenylation domain-containing protein [Saprospiraceae bacterium]